MPNKAPRFDQYQKLFCRLYEVILLLNTLNKSQGPHLVRHHDVNSILATRRRFLDNLAFICDYKKGGDSTTAIGVEDTPGHFKFWIAMNQKPDHYANIVFFMRAILTILKRAAARPVDETGELEATILKLCINLAGRKLRKVSKLFSNSVKRCISFLKETQHPSELALAAWLSQFQVMDNGNHLDLCNMAWNQRHSPEVYQLECLSKPAETTSGPNMVGQPFKDTRHHLGRLADHVRVVKQLMQDSRRLQPMIDSFHVGIIPVPETIPLPPYDGHITLEGILNRMLQSHDPRRENMDNIVAKLKQMVPPPGIEEQIVQTFQGGDFSPQVHAEVQLLEFFSPIGTPSGGGRKFAYGDRYIGCSKLSCFGCKLYFQHHPSRPVARGSHERLWHQWSLPRLAGGAKDPAFKSQRMLVQHLVREFSEAAMDGISGLVQVGVVHPGSVTDITSSATGMDTDYDTDDAEVATIC